MRKITTSQKAKGKNKGTFIKKHFLSFCLFTFAFCLSLASSAQATSEIYTRYLHGLLAERAGDLATALSDYEKVVQLDPTALEVYRDLAQLDLRTGHTEAALRAAQRVKDLAPAESSSFLFLGHVYVAHGDLALAAQEYEKALQLDPKNLKALENLANYYSTINVKKALEYYQRYLEIDPDDAEIHFQMGFLYQKDGNTPKSIAAFKESIEIEPQQVASHLALAELYEMTHSTAAAIEEYTTCTQLDPRNPAFYSRLGHIYYENQKWDEAASQFESARALAPQDSANFYYLARIAEERQQWPEASTYSEQAYRLSHDTQFLPLLAYYLTMQHKTREAVHWLEIARSVEPHNPNVLLFLGMGYIDLGKPEKAKDILEMGCETHPRDSQLHFQLAIAYDRLNQFDLAVKEFERVLQLDPHNAAAMNYLGYSYTERGVKLQEAETLISQAVKLEPDNGAFWDSLGWVHFKMGISTQAITDLEKAADLSQDALIYEHLGDAYWADQKSDKALGAWSKSLALDPKNTALHKKVEDASHHVVQGSDQRKYLKYIEGNFHQISDLRGLVWVDGRWRKTRLKTQGGVYYLRPDKFLLAIGAPATPEARVTVRGQKVEILPEAVNAQWGGFGLEGLTWLPIFFSGQLTASLDNQATRVKEEKSLLHYTNDHEEAWVDPTRGVLTRYSRLNPEGGKDILTINTYDLVDGLWLPKEIHFENETQGSQAHLRFSDWQINEPQTAHTFDVLSRSTTTPTTPQP